jgi:hypothetical protein
MKLSKFIFSIGIIFLILGCGYVIEEAFVAADDQPAVTRSNTPWWNAAWLSRTKIAIDNSHASGNLFQFPLAISFSSSEIDYSLMNADGSDLRFVDSSGTTEYSYELEYWDISGTSVFWVLIPSLPNSNFEIWMYYQNSSATSQSVETEIWNNEYFAIYHLSDDTAAGGSNIYDTQTETMAASSTGMNGANSVQGYLGKGVAFNRASSQWIALDSPNPGYYHDAFSEMTISFWLNSSDSSVVQTIFETGGSTNGIYVGITSGGTVQFSTRNSSVQVNASTALGSTGVFNHFAAVFDNSSLRLYKNGELAGSASAGYSSVGSHSGEVGVGYSPDSDGAGTSGITYLSGILDELRLSTNARSADWIKSSYLTMSGTNTNFGSREY